MGTLKSADGGPSRLQSSDGPLPRAVAREAAQWLVRSHSGEFSEAEARACLAWRAADDAHERAWQRALALTRTLASVPPGPAMKALDRKHRGRRRATLGTVAAVACAWPIGRAAWQALSPWGEAWTADHRTATGERRELRLPDGTRVQLNTDTAMDVVFQEAGPGRRGHRLIRLHRGEILIETGADEAHAPGERPFEVETPEASLRPLGTRFVVRHLGSAPEPGADAGTRVTVEDGEVEVRVRAPLPHGVVVRAGSAARVDGTVLIGPHPADPYASSWARGVLVVQGARLDALLSELARHRPGVVRCTPDVAHLRISGAFQLSSTDAVLAALPDTLPVSITYRSRWWVTVGAPSPRP